MQWRFKRGQVQDLFGGVCVGVYFLDGHVDSEDGQMEGGSSMNYGTG